MNKISLTVKDFRNISGSVLLNFDLFKNATSVTIDSRNVKRGSLFIAIKGKNFDGHDFVKDIVKLGAAAVLIQKNRIKKFQDLEIPIVAVNDTLAGLGEVARIWRKKLKAKIIGITGSNGKTSTKEMISTLLGERFNVNKSVGNNNNHIGVPLTIFNTKMQHDFLVLEMGTNHFGEIEYLSKIAEPDYALITNIGDSHLEFLKNRKGVLKEKSALFRVTSKKNGFLFINNDDPLLKNSFDDYKNRITFGFNSSSNVNGELIGFTKDGKSKLAIKHGNSKFIVNVPFAGLQNANNFLASAAVGLEFGLTKSQIISAAKKVKNVNKRLNIRKIKDFVLIDDTYNANPESTKLAIDLTSKFDGCKNRVLILGDMFELGKQERKLHEGLLSSVKKNKSTHIFTIGKRMKYLSDKLSNTKIPNKHFSSRKRLKDYIQKFDFSNSVILVKGSRGMKMEEFVNAILEKN